MRRTSLRPRQIDVHARMRIIRREEDLEMDDDGGAGASGAASAVSAGPSASSGATTFAELIAVRVIPCPAVCLLMCDRRTHR